jgi:uncharacterized protein (TIGR00369 family)
MDESAARLAFDNAIRTHQPGFETFFLAKLFGLRISYPGDFCQVEFDVTDFMFNPQGSLHGGILAFALDVSAGHFIHHTTGLAGVTLEMKTQYLRPARAGRLRCAGRFLKRGRRISYMESRASDQDGKLIAVATSTWQMPSELPERAVEVS